MFSLAPLARAGVTTKQSPTHEEIAHLHCTKRSAVQVSGKERPRNNMNYSYANTSRMVKRAALRAGKIEPTTESNKTSPNQMA